jgi:hypothetical protein
MASEPLVCLIFYRGSESHSGLFIEGLFVKSPEG